MEHLRTILGTRIHVVAVEAGTRILEGVAAGNRTLPEAVAAADDKLLR